MVRLGAANSPHSSGAAWCGKYAAPYCTGLKSGGARLKSNFQPSKVLCSKRESYIYIRSRGRAGYVKTSPALQVF